MSDTGDRYPTTSSQDGRLAAMEAKMRALEAVTQSTFAKVDGSLGEVHRSLSTLSTTLAVVNERMVTKGDCEGRRAQCDKVREGKSDELEGRVESLEQDAKVATALKDATDPRMPLLKTEPKEKFDLAASVKKWAGVVAAVLTLSGFGTMATCMHNTVQAIRGDIQVSNATAAGASAELQGVQVQLKRLESTRPVLVAPPMTVPVLVEEPRPRRPLRTAVGKKAIPR